MTTNAEKLHIAQMQCQRFGVDLVQITVPDVPEIQGEDNTVIIEHKARAAFELAKQPLVVSDDGWNFPALGGFPGAYMKSMNYWFKSADFLRLMHGIEERQVYIEQYLTYIDQRQLVTFHASMPGVVLDEVRGSHQKAPIMNVVTLDSDNGMSITEAYESGYANSLERYEKQPDAWEALTTWYKDYHGS